MDGVDDVGRFVQIALIARSCFTGMRHALCFTAKTRATRHDVMRWTRHALRHGLLHTECGHPIPTYPLRRTRSQVASLQIKACCVNSGLFHTECVT